MDAWEEEGLPWRWTMDLNKIVGMIVFVCYLCPLCEQEVSYPYLTESELLEFQSRLANIFFSLENRFAECNFKKHSANSNSMLRKKNSLENRFAECNSKNTRQTIILCRVYFGKTLGKPLFFLLSVRCDTRQTICRVRDKKHSANYCLPTLLMSCVVFLGLCQVPLALGKTTVSRSVWFCCAAPVDVSMKPDYVCCL